MLCYTGNSSTPFARAVAVDSSGNVIVTGQSYRDAQTSDLVTVAYSNGGVPLWTNRYNGPANGDDVPFTKRSLALGPNGSVYVTAASDGDFSAGQILDFVTIKYTVSPHSASPGRPASQSSPGPPPSAIFNFRRTRMAGRLLPRHVRRTTVSLASQRPPPATANSFA